MIEIDNIKFKSDSEIDKIRNNIWNVSAEEYKKKVEDYKIFASEWRHKQEEERMSKDTLYRWKVKFNKNSDLIPLVLQLVDGCRLKNLTRTSFYGIIYMN